MDNPTRFTEPKRKPFDTEQTMFIGVNSPLFVADWGWRGVGGVEDQDRWEQT